MQTYNDSSDEVHARVVGFAQISRSASQSFLCNVVMVKTGTICCLIVVERGGLICDILLYLLFLRHSADDRWVVTRNDRVDEERGSTGWGRQDLGNWGFYLGKVGTRIMTHNSGSSGWREGES